MTTEAPEARRAGGILLLHHTPTLPWEVSYAPNVGENIAAFGRHSRFPVWPANVAYGFRPGLAGLRFDAIVLHYSMFTNRPEGYLLDEGYLDFLRGSDAYKVAFFQDEHQWVGRRLAFIDDHGIDCVYTMLEPPYAEQVYGERTSASRVVTHLPSYVGAELVEGASRFAKPDPERRIDIGYRGRPSPSNWGRGAQEKYEIGVRFAELVRDSGLAIDIGAEEDERIYGDDWYRFLADCRGTLGAESGATCFDLEDEVLADYQRLSANGHEPTLDELEQGAMAKWEDRIPYRTVTPRNFEAAALEVCQVLYEGQYSGVIEPMRHYIPLRKDFSNLDEALERFRDADLRGELTRHARADLIDSGEYGYERFVAGFDAILIDAGLEPRRSEADEVVRAAIHRSPRERWAYFEETRLSWLYGRSRFLWRLTWTVLHPIKAVRQEAAKLVARFR